MKSDEVFQDIVTFKRRKFTYLLVSTSNAQMSHSAIRSALTASFSAVGIFTKFEYTRVSPTHIRAHVQHLGAKRKVLKTDFLQSIL